MNKNIALMGILLFGINIESSDTSLTLLSQITSIADFPLNKNVWIGNGNVAPAGKTIRI